MTDMPLSQPVVLDYTQWSLGILLRYNVFSNECGRTGELSVSCVDKCDRCTMQCELHKIW